MCVTIMLNTTSINRNVTKMKKILLSMMGLVLLALGTQSCGDSLNETFRDYTDEEYALITQKLELPYELFDYSTSSENNFFEGETNDGSLIFRRSNHKATLGRVLFYDNKLSINESISCASCHKQDLAFADDVAFSEGFDGQITTRNSLPLGNTIGFETAYGGFNGRAQFSWDEANDNISQQSKAAILSEIEMGLDMEKLVDRIQKDDIYPILFKKSYGDETIVEHRILDAIEAFVNSISSTNSKFDKELLKTNHNTIVPFVGFTDQENLGKELYMDNCSSCHSRDHNFTSIAVANNGLDMEYEDKGVGGRTNNSFQFGVFKVPFLRNIELTAPYMHDGRFATLREVIDHYSDGIADHPNLHPNLKVGSTAMKMAFSEDEKQALEAYLKTLTDNSLMDEVKFSNPFK